MLSFVSSLMLSKARSHTHRVRCSSGRWPGGCPASQFKAQRGKGVA